MRSPICIEFLLCFSMVVSFSLLRHVEMEKIESKPATRYDFTDDIIKFLKLRAGKFKN